ncbi:MAG: tRNA preQ1(34) S-adenosylmethionine ribosyltransferase-isomerase QueA [Thioalkalispiraceae bacterium]|jgi:S-adenosylmethionine:tRNA ribosyltransferase-isomerase
MKLKDFDYQLPSELIAQFPTEQRTDSRLLVLNRATQKFDDRLFTNIESFLEAGDLLVMNNTRVIAARLYGEKQTGGKLEVLIERILNEHEVLAQVRASKSPKPGSTLIFANSISADVLRRRDEFFHLRFGSKRSVLDVLDEIGHIPLPPYIERSDKAEDFERYQTVYAEQPGAVAAPTAGLHFDKQLLSRLENKGVNIGYVTLHVGAGTFQPVRVEHIADHKMHEEWISVDQTIVTQIEQTKQKGGRVIAIGTTTVRCLETAALAGTISPFEGETDIFITPGFEFKVVDALLTNFHLPESTLLMLVSAFAGYKLTMAAYQHAVKQRYRFFSYGDAMLIL